MTGVDWVIIAFTLLMAAWGYLQGLIVGALSLAGFAGGAVLGSRLGPLLLEEGSHSPYAPLFALLGAVMLGGALASLAEVVGLHLRARMRDRFEVFDGVGGAVLVGCLGLGLAWIAGAVALQTPGARELREPIQRSAILQALNERLPPSGGILKALARFDPFPSIAGPSPGVPAPNRGSVRDPDVRAAGRAVVRVLGTACGLGVEGSGWIAGRGLVVTNAHVVAGQDDTTVQLQGAGARLDTLPVWFDPRNDVAILRVPGLGGAARLRLRESAPVGSSGAILGYPENGPFDAQPARLGPTQTVISEDAYGRGPVRRRMTAIRGLIRHGNSGGPVVDLDGRVVATVFAASASGGARTGFGVPDSVVGPALRRVGGEVDTGPCA